MTRLVKVFDTDEEAKLDEVYEMKNLAEQLGLLGYEAVEKFTEQQLTVICNGIGPRFFPTWVREAISTIYRDLAVCAFIHDVEYYIGGGKEEWEQSNLRFKLNGYTVAKKKYGWWNPLRYRVMWNAYTFYKLVSSKSGWKAFNKKDGADDDEESEEK
ncbi:hypothetical protein ADUPG1_008646 [Aduncisulcus paluster]|uniref:Uncharacterized protein n=1 Tax=Aduncisulcus paluster TaxID=2918883 RepID=A0ABQ5KSQ1_9EUKA|nr:hypothetical protein ADUPG1_008646 [Aduncisulcus paluster]